MDKFDKIYEYWRSRANKIMEELMEKEKKK
jgi:hypothetical protein